MVSLESAESKRSPFTLHRVSGIFCYVDRQRSWVERRNHLRTVGRIYNVSPREGERFYLRMVLNHIRGAQSFADCRTINGIVYPTYKSAAVALGITRSNEDYNNVLAEAIQAQAPNLCRELFAYILIFCTVVDPLELWQSFRVGLSEDIIYRHPSQNLNDCCDAALIQIENILRMHGRNLSDFNLPEPSRNLNFIDTLFVSNRNFVRDEELGMNTPADIEQFERNFSLLTNEQRTIYDQVMRSVDEYPYGQDNLFFINAPGGTGKTFLLNTILSGIRTQGHIALAVASSGIASLLLRGGRTAHSRFKIPLAINETSTCNIAHNSPLAQLIRDAKIIIWDEAVMTHKFVFQCVDKTFRSIMQSNEKFGGKVIVLGGDFRQILPVVPLGGKEEIINACLKLSYLWEGFQNLFLTENLRADRRDQLHNQFTGFLNRIGDGQFLPNFDNAVEKLVRIPEPMLCRAPDLRAFKNEVFPDIENNIDTARFSNTAILAPTNSFVHELNEIILGLFRPNEPQIQRTYLSADSLNDNESYDNRLNITPEFLNSINVPSLPPHELNLKINCIVILIRNINIKRGLCNGTRLMVEQMHDNYIVARILTGNHANTITLIPKIQLTSSPEDRYPFTFERYQFPIKLAFAMTINKAQGQTFERVGAYLISPVFTHGQLYVALSRAITASSIRVFFDDTEQNSTKNEVYNEVLNLQNHHPA